MLMRFLANLVGLNIPWLVDDLLLDFLAFVAFGAIFFWVYDDYKGFVNGLYRFIVAYLFLYAVLDVMQLMGWTFFTHNHFLEFSLLQLGLGAIIANTRLQKYQLPILVISFFALSWLIT